MLRTFLSVALPAGCAAFLFAAGPAHSLPMIGHPVMQVASENPLLVRARDGGQNRGSHFRNRNFRDRGFHAQRSCDRWNDWCGRRRWHGGSDLNFSFGFGSPFFYEPGYAFGYPRYRPYWPRYTYRYGDDGDIGIPGGLTRHGTYGLLGGSHYEWCRNRYRSYNPRTDTFLSYGGVYKRCNSPFD